MFSLSIVDLRRIGSPELLAAVLFSRSSEKDKFSCFSCSIGCLVESVVEFKFELLDLVEASLVFWPVASLSIYQKGGVRGGAPAPEGRKFHDAYLLSPHSCLYLLALSSRDASGLSSSGAFVSWSVPLPGRRSRAGFLGLPLTFCFSRTVVARFLFL